MKQTVNSMTAERIEEIKRFPTVTNPISAPDLNVPQAYAYSLRRAIVIDCNEYQRAELAKLLSGKDTPEGVAFNNTKANRYRLHIWQNEQARKQRTAILGNGWTYSGNLYETPQASIGDQICCIDGTTGICIEANPSICIIKFKSDADGSALTVCGYFFRTQEQAFNDVLTISKGDKVISKLYGSMGIVTGIRQEKGQTHYDVRFEKPIKSIWSDETSYTGDFSRFGITKNFDAQGREIIGSAVYYAEELQADYWLGKARKIYDLEILPPTENRPQWLVNYDLLNTPKLATLYEIASYLSALYQEHRAA